jgi:hypothetical protein
MIEEERVFEAPSASEPWDPPVPKRPHRFAAAQVLVATAVVLVLVAGVAGVAAAATARSASQVRARAHTEQREQAVLDRRYEAAVVERELIGSRKAKLIEAFAVFRDALIAVTTAHDQWTDIADKGSALYNAGKFPEAAAVFRSGADELQRMQEAVAGLNAAVSKLQAARQALEEKL